MAQAGAVIGVPGFVLVIVAAPLDLPFLFLARQFPDRLRRRAVRPRHADRDHEPAPRDQAGLALGAWGAVQATAAGVGMIAERRHPRPGQRNRRRGLWGPLPDGAANGYIAVYSLEITLLGRHRRGRAADPPRRGGAWRADAALVRETAPVGRPAPQRRHQSLRSARMAILPILEYPDPRLRLRAVPVEAFDARPRRLADDLCETLLRQGRDRARRRRWGVLAGGAVTDLSAARRRPTSTSTRNPLPLVPSASSRRAACPCRASSATSCARRSSPCGPATARAGLRAPSRGHARRLPAARNRPSRGQAVHRRRRAGARIACRVSRD
jgi:hypothetical protein